MAVASPSPLILADTVPSAAPAPVPLGSAARKRLSLLSALVDAGCEIVALAGTGLAALAGSRPHDALMDADLLALRREARRAAQASSVHRCGCARAFVRIDALASSAQAHDAAEDGLIAKAPAVLARIGEIGRGVNRALTRELGKRGWTGGAR